jgi:hypothetical protein
MPLFWTVQNFADGSSRTGVHHASTVKLMIGGVPVDKVTASPNPDWPWLDQVSGLLSKSLSGAGAVNVYLVADSVSSNSLHLTFQ